MTSKRWCMHPDLGIYMGRHSILNSYLMNILGVICGRFGVRGGNVIPGMVMPLGFHADERNPKTWRTVATNMPPAAAGSFPPAVMPEEILNDHPERLRAVYVNGCNPLRSYPDTTAYEKAFEQARSSGGLRRGHERNREICPLRAALPQRLRILGRHFFLLDLSRRSTFRCAGPWSNRRRTAGKHRRSSPQLPTGSGSSRIYPKMCVQAARGNRLHFGAELMEWAAREPAIRAKMPFILAKTLGEVWDSANKAALWGMLMTAPKSFRENAARAGFQPGIDQGDRIFQAILDTPQGLWVGQADTANPMAGIGTSSGKIEVYIPELEEQVKALNAVQEEEDLQLPAAFPLILNAGRHMKYNANTLMRNPGLEQWQKRPAQWR